MKGGAEDQSLGKGGGWLRMGGVRGRGAEDCSSLGLGR